MVVVSAWEADPDDPRPLAALEVPRLVPDPEIDDELAELEGVSQDLAASTQAEGTRRVYDGAWRSFTTFCRVHDLTPLPAHPQVIRWYVAWMSRQVRPDGSPRFAVTTIRTHLAGLADAHVRAGLLDPTTHHGVTDLVRGLARLRQERPIGRRPLLLTDVTRICAAMDHSVYPAGISAARDHLALLLGFAGALRRSEVAALRMDAVRLHPEDGVHLRLGRTKTDQDAARRELVALPFGTSGMTCAPCAVLRWAALVRAGGIVDARASRRETLRLLLRTDLEQHVCARGAGQPAPADDLGLPGHLLRATYRNRRSASIHSRGVTGDALHSMLLTRMVEAGMDPRGYGFHSLRSGHVTEARRSGASTEEIMRAGRWTRAETIEVYDRELTPLVRNSVTRLGL